MTFPFIITKKDIKRFLVKINKTEDCWLWTACKNSQGYGRINLKGKLYLAHRFAWMISRKKKIPKDLYICHKCDNPSCVRPSHLFLGTYKDNMKDMMNKNRQSKGSHRPNSVLKESDIIKIRKLYVKGLSQKEIAEIYHINPSNVSRILSRNNWKHTNNKCIQSRGRKGTSNGRSKLNEEKVKDIRNQYQQGDITYKELAEEYDVSDVAIAKIIRRENWANV